MVFQALSDLYFGSVNYANRNIRRTLAKQAVFGHLLKAAIESAFFVLSYGGSHVFSSRRIYYTPLFFSCPSTQPADMEKTETSV